jgi:S-formylglutathione hydrolase FrmB
MLVAPLLHTRAVGTARAVVEKGALPSDVRLLRVGYRAWDGRTRRAYVILPRWYGPRHDPPIPLVISPHGRGVPARANVRIWGDLPARGPFAVVNPEGQGRRFALYSWGDPGQVDDLARMPAILRRNLPWLRIEPRRIYAFGGSMGGQETLLLVARHPRLLAGAASFDADTDLSLRYLDFPALRYGDFLQWAARQEVGGTPGRDPSGYADRSPLHYARKIAASGVPLQLWWSTRDQIVVDQATQQSGLLYRRIEELRPRAPVYAFVGTWVHTAEMRWFRRLPTALRVFGLLGSRSPLPSKVCQWSIHMAAALADRQTQLSVPGFRKVATGPSGGTLLSGVYPDSQAPRPLRRGYLYLPPKVDPNRRYPVVYLLHGMPGDPDEYVNSLSILSVADGLIATGAVKPFIAVMPAAGSSVHYDGEWAGPWEQYLVHGVVPWVDAHLPTQANAAGRTLAGLSAGGYGAFDIGLRSPSLFGRIESWSGYFSPLHDGPFAHADARTLAANDPTKLVRAEAARLRALGTRFYLGSGPTHSHWFKEQETIAYAALLARLRLPFTLKLVPSLKGEWRSQFEAGLRWALAPTPPPSGAHSQSGSSSIPTASAIRLM